MSAKMSPFPQMNACERFFDEMSKTPINAKTRISIFLSVTFSCKKSRPKSAVVGIACKKETLL